MIDRLLDGPASVSELARPLAISLPAVVQHLHVLEASGVVRSHKAGRVRTCEIEPLALGTAERWISERVNRPVRSASTEAPLLAVGRPRL